MSVISNNGLVPIDKSLTNLTVANIGVINQLISDHIVIQGFVDPLSSILTELLNEVNTLENELIEIGDTIQTQQVAIDANTNNIAITTASATPAALSTVSNLTIDALVEGETQNNTAPDTTNVWSLGEYINSGGAFNTVIAPVVRVTIAEGTTSGSIYMVPYFIGSAANARIWAKWYAQRLI
jgi:hypothetical protein